MLLLFLARVQNSIHATAVFFFSPPLAQRVPYLRRVGHGADRHVLLGNLVGDDSAALVAGAGRYGKVSASLPAARTVNSRGAQSHARAQTKPASHLLEVGYERLQHLDAALLELACEHLAFLVGL